MKTLELLERTLGFYEEMYEKVGDNFEDGNKEDFIEIALHLFNKGASLSPGTIVMLTKFQEEL